MIAHLAIYGRLVPWPQQPTITTTASQRSNTRLSSSHSLLLARLDGDRALFAATNHRVSAPTVTGARETWGLQCACACAQHLRRDNRLPKPHNIVDRVHTPPNTNNDDDDDNAHYYLQIFYSLTNAVVPAVKSAMISSCTCLNAAFNACSTFSSLSHHHTHQHTCLPPTQHNNITLTLISLVMLWRRLQFHWTLEWQPAIHYIIIIINTTRLQTIFIYFSHNDFFFFRKNKPMSVKNSKQIFIFPKKRTTATHNRSNNFHCLGSDHGYLSRNCPTITIASSIPSLLPKNKQHMNQNSHQQTKHNLNHLYVQKKQLKSKSSHNKQNSKALLFFFQFFKFFKKKNKNIKIPWQSATPTVNLSLSSITTFSYSLSL